MIGKIAKRLGKKLKASRRVLVTAESCTGGWVAQAVTSVAGSSDWFERGYVTYSNAAKRELLGVSKATLARYGAVSERTAREMASGALRRSRATVALSVTGVAGPGGGYQINTYIDGVGWDPAEPVLGVGDAVWIQSSGAHASWTRVFSVN